VGQIASNAAKLRSSPAASTVRLGRPAGMAYAQDCLSLLYGRAI